MSPKLSERARTILAGVPAAAVESLRLLPRGQAAELLAELADLPREFVQGDDERGIKPKLSSAQRATRRALLLADDITVWFLDDVAAAAGLGVAVAYKWRNGYLSTGVVSENALCAPDVPTRKPYRKHGDPATAPAGHPGYATPMFYAGTAARLWLAQSERIDEDLYPRADGKGRKPPGRTPGARRDELIDA